MLLTRQKVFRIVSKCLKIIILRTDLFQTSYWFNYISCRLFVCLSLVFLLHFCKMAEEASSRKRKLKDLVYEEDEIIFSGPRPPLLASSSCTNQPTRHRFSERMGGGPNRGQNPVEWGDFLCVYSHGHTWLRGPGPGLALSERSTGWLRQKLFG